MENKTGLELFEEWLNEYYDVNGTPTFSEMKIQIAKIKGYGGFIKFNQDTVITPGIYEIKTNKNRIIEAEYIFNTWMEYSTPIIEGEKVEEFRIKQ